MNGKIFGFHSALPTNRFGQDFTEHTAGRCPCVSKSFNLIGQDLTSNFSWSANERKLIGNENKEFCVQNRVCGAERDCGNPGLNGNPSGAKIRPVTQACRKAAAFWEKRLVPSELNREGGGRSTTYRGSLSCARFAKDSVKCRERQFSQ